MRIAGRWSSIALTALMGAVVLAPAALAYDPAAGDYGKEDARDVRIMAYNTHGEFIVVTSKDAAFNRILTTINPDIISFEEMPLSLSTTTITNRLNTVLPIAGGGSWQLQLGKDDGTIRNVIASRYPLSLKRNDTIPISSTRGIDMALADLPNATHPVDVYILSVHLKCCGNPGGTEDAKRQRSADAVVNWMADARGVSRASGENIALPPGTPMVILGDFNMVGGPQPEQTFLTGNIQDEGTFGTDVKDDWDVSDLTNLNPLDPFNGSNITWQSDGVFPSSNLDRIIYTDNPVIVAHSFVLNTNTMSAAALAATGLHAGDTLPSGTSDHLPIVMDLRIPQCTSFAQCDDGQFCKGVETCAAGLCRAATAGACSGAWCDETANSCRTYGDGDTDADGDLDLVDYSGVQRCIGHFNDPACFADNLVGSNGLIDLADYNALAGGLTGPQ